MMTAEKLWTVNDIKTALRVRGSHWFDPDTMRFFGTRVLDTVYQGPGGIYFVTSEKPPHGERGYTIRKFTLPADISTVGEVASMSKGRAQREAQRLAGEGAQAKQEAFKPVSILEQFVADLNKHGNNPTGVAKSQAEGLIILARKHHRLMEKLCSDEAFCRQVDAEGNHPRITDCRASITARAKLVGASGVIFSGDPRGCTVKLTFADGFTNDFGGEGYCIPTEEK